MRIVPRLHLRARLYALQQRLAITTPEAAVILGLTGLLFVGVCVRYVQGQAVPFDASHYAELDRQFRAQSDSLRAQLNADTLDQSVEESSREPERRPRRPSTEPVRMNLNTASARLLQRLPGVGPKLAERIIEHREAHGPFRRARDIVQVRGIGPKTYEKMAPYLFVEGEEE